MGVDVNIAARVAEAAKGGEVLVSEAARSELDETDFQMRRRRRFRGKGTPQGLEHRLEALRPLRMASAGIVMPAGRIPNDDRHYCWRRVCSRSRSDSTSRFISLRAAASSAIARR